MADFLAIIERERSADRPSPPTGMRWHDVPWGRLAIANHGWQELHNDAFFVGRPAARDGGDLKTSAHEALDGQADGYGRLSGIFLLLQPTDDGVVICTDRLSHIAVYVHESDDRAVLSTSVELIAREVGPMLDEISLAEMVLWDNPTFPYTTRQDVRQLAPGSVHRAQLCERAIELRSTPLWQPSEPARWPTKRACIDAAIAGAEASAREIAANGDRLGIMLSGGLDSRIVAATLAKHAHAEAFTYLDHDNRESRSAARTAEVLGIEHHLVYRDPAFYAHAFDRGLELVGFEQNALPCHSLCLVDHPAVGGLDAIVGGFGCDILMKSAYVPYAMRDLVLANRGLRRLVPERRIGKHNYSQAHKRRSLVRPDLVEAAYARRRAYEEQLREIRPRSAEEWIGFYPISQTTSIDSAVADRSLSHDEFFFHAGLVEASAMTPAVWKKGLDIISAMGKRLAPGLAELPHPDSGRPATLRYYPERILGKLRPRTPPAVDRPAGTPSWYSDGSFVKYAAFFADCPEWIERREAAFVDAEAVDALAKILTVDPREVLGRGESRYGSLLNAMAVQLLRLQKRAASAGRMTVGEREAAS